MAHHVKGCQGDIPLDTVILHQRTIDLKSGNTSNKIDTKIVNLALTIQSKKRTISIKDGKKRINLWKENVWLKN